MKGICISNFIRAGSLFLSLFLFCNVHSQLTYISDSIINDYKKITAIHSAEDNDPDSVYVEDATTFIKNEVALFIVNRGATIYSNGDIENMNNTGKYALIYIDTVEYDKNLVIFNSTLPGVAPLRSGESAQLVTVPRYKNAVVTGKLTSKDWDNTSGTGGVLVLIVNSTLELQANIDVSGKGFRGAIPGSEKYEGSCSVADAGYSKGLFRLEAKDSAALRGEGIIATNFLYPRGKLAAGNGGAGGNAKFSGGGGGSNGGSGGNGGYEYNGCSPGNNMGGSGGTALRETFYSNIDPLYANRIYMGGGGGAGTQDPDQGKIATNGGNGGGIIIILANRIKASGHAIKTNGKSVTAVATAGGGGGGGGGVVLTDVLEFIDNLTIEAMGGKGGDVTYSPTDTTGPGGGGGGGIYWFNQNMLPSMVSSIRMFGVSGNSGTETYGASNGSSGYNMPNLVLPRRGFIENRIPDDQAICENMTPAPLNAPPAKGGNGGPYTYSWIQSEISDEGPWIQATGINDQQTYTPPALIDTTYYARIVSDGSLTDTSFAILIAVHPGLKNNSIIDNDTICAELSAGELTSVLEMSGGLGSGSYAYLWENSTDNLNWQSSAGENSLFSYVTPELTGTTYFRRKVTSGACIDSSNSVEIYVFPVLSNNLISPEQIICFEQQPAALTGTEPNGGKPGDRKYLWQSLQLPGSWTDEAATSGFSPGILSDSTWYRRIVYSGPENTCVNISDSLEIAVLPEIVNNILNNQDTTICFGLPSITITGMQPSGGDGIYKYIWEKKPYSSGTWAIAQEFTELQPFQPGSLNDSTWFRRIIKSGAADVCSNISDSFSVNVLPPLTGNSINSPQLICEGESPLPLNGTSPSGGTGTFIYQWQQSPDGTSDWVNSEPSGTSADFIPPSLANTTYYRRMVFSGPENTCESYSGNIKIEVQPTINNNIIETQSPVFTCYNTQPVQITGSTAFSGGDGVNYTCTWFESDDQILWSEGSETNNQVIYQPGMLTKEMFYRRLLQSGVCYDSSGILNIKINALPVLNQLTGSLPGNVLCDDVSFRLKVDIGNGKAPYSAEYVNGIEPTAFNQALPTDTSSFEVNIYGAAPNSFNFKITSLTDDNGCMAEDLNLAALQLPLDVYRASNPGINMSDTVSVCSTSVTLEAIPDVGNGHWENINPLVIINNPSAISAAASFEIPSFNILTEKFFYIESTPGCGERKDSVIIIFYEEPADALITNNGHDGSSFIVFLSDHVTLTASPPTAGSGSWNILSGTGTLSEKTDTTVYLADLVIDEQITVSFTITNGVCPLKTDEIDVERKDVKVYEGFSPNGDLLNDYLYAEGINRSSTDLTYIFSIFNSSGEFIRELNNETTLEIPDNNVIWDGKTESGNLAGDGTYYYVLRLNYKSRQFIYKGFFVIKSE